MSKNNVIIVGAGLAGLIAGCHFKDATIVDHMPGPNENHTALLRFRTTSVAEVTGIPFRKVDVQKAVYSGDRVMSYASIRDQNLYSMKVAGVIAARSIGDLSACERYVAPEDFYAQLIDKLSDRIWWSTPIASVVGQGNIVSTAPMSVNMAAVGSSETALNFGFHKSSIQVSRYKLAVDADVFQTVYFPDPDCDIFRASITGNTLIIESITDEDGIPNASLSNKIDLDLALYAFGLRQSDLLIGTFNFNIQKFGKMVDMPKAEREAVMFDLTHNHNIYSLGRFATWRNILLDDVVADLDVIKRLMSASEYSRRLIAVK